MLDLQVELFFEHGVHPAFAVLGDGFDNLVEQVAFEPFGGKNLPDFLANRDHCVDETKALIVCDRADELFHHLHLSQDPFADTTQDRFEIDDTAEVDASALLRGHVRIGAGARIGPGVVISGPASVGRDASIEARAVVGCDGLYAKTVLGVRRHMPHFGGVEIGDSSRILAGAVVVRSAIHGEVTRVGAGACVGVLSNIGHDTASTTK